MKCPYCENTAWDVDFEEVTATSGKDKRKCLAFSRLACGTILGIQEERKIRDADLLKKIEAIVSRYS